MRTVALEHWHSDAFTVYGEVLEEREIAIDRVLVPEAEKLPDWHDYDLVIAMGGPMSVNDEDEHPWLIWEKRFIREAVEAGTPYFGVCFGAQLLASSLEAEVYRGPTPELGLNRVFLTEAARRDPVFRGFPRELEVFEWHQDAFELPSEAVCLARSPRYGNQALRVGRVAYAIQCHLEKSAADVVRSLEAKPALMHELERRHGTGSVHQFVDEYAAFVPVLQETARQLLRRWLVVASEFGGTAASASTPLKRSRNDQLIARTSEQEWIGGRLADARKGGSSATVIRGDAGLGKTALLEWGLGRAHEMRVLRCVGIETDAELPFSGLRELCAPLLETLGRLPRAQGEALGAALDLREPTLPGDRFAVYSGFSALLAEASHEAPILVAVDDAHWLDEASAEALAFAIRQGGPAGTAYLIAAEGEAFAGPGIAELTLERLDEASMRSVLETRGDPVLDPEVADRLLKVAAGNPLTLLELARALTPTQRAGLEDAQSLLHIRATAEEAFLHRILGLPAASQRALLPAVLDEDGDLEILGLACRDLGIDLKAFEAAESAGLLNTTGDRIVFRHPLVRSAVAYGASIADRRAAHGALARALAGSPDSDRRVWHLARAAVPPDAEAADQLAATAQRAHDRRAYGAAARAYELAAHLTPDTEVRSRRLLRAAETAYRAGHVSTALDHLEAAATDVSDGELLADIEHLQGRVAARTGSAERARTVLVAAAERCRQEDPGKAALMLSDAVIPSLRSGRPEEARELGRKAMTLAEGADPPTRVTASMMLGTALFFTGDFASARDLVSEAADLAEEPPGQSADVRAYLGRSLRLAGYHERARLVLEELVAEARAEGALGLLPYALARLGDLELECGRWRAARDVLEEAIRLARETGQGADEGLGLGTLGWLDAAQGRADDCRTHVAAALDLAARLGTGSLLDRAGLALGLLELGEGRPRMAIRHLEKVLTQQRDQGWSDAAVTPHASPDLIEAYLLDGRTDDACELLEAFDAEARRADRPSALAAAARCRALVDGDGKADWFAKSLAYGESDGNSFERARTELRYAAFLREAGELENARKEATAALAAFESIGAEPWARQAQAQLRELRAGVTARDVQD